MRLLLDTHVVLWLVDDVESLPTGWAELITVADVVHLSSVVGWEVGVKRSLGRLEAPAPSRIVQELEPLGYRRLAVSWEHAATSAELPWLHRDPFDRLLVAQAQIEGLVLATVDSRIRSYDVRVLGVDPSDEHRTV